jgi:hypothetical protein
MIDTPDFIEPGDVDGGPGPLPLFVTRTTLRAMQSGMTSQFNFQPHTFLHMQ